MTGPHIGDSVKFRVDLGSDGDAVYAGIVKATRFAQAEDEPRSYDVFVPLHDLSYTVFPEQLVEWPGKDQPELSPDEQRAVDILQGRPFPIAPGRYGPGHPLHDARSYADWQAAHQALLAEMGEEAYTQWYGEAFEAALWLLAPGHERFRAALRLNDEHVPADTIGAVESPVNGASRTHHPDVLGGEERIADRLDFLEDRLDLLVLRLEPVLAPPNSDAPVEQLKGFDTTAPLASTLYKHGARVARAGDRVDALISRLEI